MPQQHFTQVFNPMNGFPTGAEIRAMKAKSGRDDSENHNGRKVVKKIPGRISPSLRSTRQR